jgi:hypothetical protein
MPVLPACPAQPAMNMDNGLSRPSPLARFKQPDWLQRFATVALLLGAYVTGVWADLMRGRWPDYFDVQTAIVAMIFAWVASEFAIPAIDRLPARGASLAIAAGLGAIYVALAHAFPTFLAGLLQAPLGGLGMVSSAVDGLFYTVRQAWLPAVACGLPCGAVSRMLLQARQRIAQPEGAAAAVGRAD